MKPAMLSAGQMVGLLKDAPKPLRWTILAAVVVATVGGVTLGWRTWPERLAAVERRTNALERDVNTLRVQLLFVCLDTPNGSLGAPGSNVARQFTCDQISQQVQAIREAQYRQR